MPTLPSRLQEKFARFVAEGYSQRQAYIAAGYGRSTSGPNRLARKPYIVARVAELRPLLAEAVARQVARMPVMPRAPELITPAMLLSRERIGRELGLLAFANMKDYTRGVGADLVVDFSNVTDDQMAAIQEVVIETYIEGRGEAAERVKRVKFKLYNKIDAAMNLARLMGLVAEKGDDEVEKLADRLRKMTPEQRAQRAGQLADRMRARLAELPPEDDDGVTDVNGEDVPAEGSERGRGGPRTR